MASEKLHAIKHLFFTTAGWDSATQSLTRPLVTSTDIVHAITHCNTEYGKALSTKNPANFLKDIVRNDSASGNWPKDIADFRFTARQVTGNKNVFVFLPYGADQTVPFPDPYLPSDETPRHPIQSLSQSLESKELGRTDEAWLLQTAINLRVVETHFALESDVEVLQIVHLQMSVKLAKTEIDALFYAKCRDANGNAFSAIITCEAKQAGERILDTQICEQVLAVFKQRKLRIGDAPVDYVIPIAMRVIKDRDGNGGIYLAEFPLVSRADLGAFTYNSMQQLNGTAPMCHIPIQSEGLYKFHPSVKGIG